MYKPENRPGEVNAAQRLVNLLLGKGYALSVYDGEEWACKGEVTEGPVMDALGETDCDVLRARFNGVKVGDFTLIWGNDPDGTELIADHTCDDAGVMEALAEEWSVGQQEYADRRAGIRR